MSEWNLETVKCELIEEQWAIVRLDNPPVNTHSDQMQMNKFAPAEAELVEPMRRPVWAGSRGSNMAKIWKPI